MKRSGQTRLLFPLSISVLLHLLLAALVVFVRAPERQRGARIYQIYMESAPKGPRDVGVVTKAPPKNETKTTPKSTSPRISTNPPKTPDKAAPKPVVDPSRSTPIPEAAKSKSASADEKSKAAEKAAAPTRAGGGPEGKSGVNTVDVAFKGLEFPDQPYLQNIINKVMSNFPDQRMALVAEFSFDIMRNGCIKPGSLKMIKRSVNSQFNGDAQGAIERASRNCGFGRLPVVWEDEILSVQFVFDPKNFRG